MNTSIKVSLGRNAILPSRQMESRNKCAEIAVTRWLKVSRRKFLELRRKENPGV